MHTKRKSPERLVTILRKKKKLNALLKLIIDLMLMFYLLVDMVHFC
jgi:hypothetical protein